MNNPSLIIDIVLILLLVFSAVKAYNDGFFSRVVTLAGKFVRLFAGYFASKTWAPAVFAKLRPSIVERSYNYLTQAARSIDVSTALKGVLGNLPSQFTEGFIQNAGAHLTDVLTPDMDSAVYLVDTIIAPVVTGIISIVIFIAVFIAVNVLCFILAHLLKTVNEVPLLGSANQTLGLFIGIASGAINIIVLSFLLSIIVIITGDGIPLLNSAVLTGSKILALTGIVNPLLP